MKNRLLIIVNDENTNIYPIIEQLSIMNKILIPKKETTDESLSFYSSFYNLSGESDFVKMTISRRIKSYSKTENGYVGYKADNIGQGYADLYNGKGNLMLLSITKEELPYYAHYYNHATFAGIVTSNPNDNDKMSELLDIVFIDNADLMNQINQSIKKIIIDNPYVYEKK